MIYLYKRRPSISGRFLAQLLGARVTDNSRPLKRPQNSFVVNWGCSSEFSIGEKPDVLLNNPIAVGKAVDKLDSFRVFKAARVSSPEFSTNIRDAQEKLLDGSWNAVICRKLLRASGGEGIVFAKTPDDLVDAPLYTQYIPKSQEFRVHVFQGSPVLVQEKRRKRGAEVDTRVRSHDNGWVFCLKNVIIPPQALDSCVDAVKALGLDFGAVDVIYSKRLDTSFVLEVNTSPGLCPTSAGVYWLMINKLYKGTRPDAL